MLPILESSHPDLRRAAGPALASARHHARTDPQGSLRH